MNEVVLYLLKVSAMQGVFFAFYWLFLRKNVRHGSNRAYLILSFLLAFFIPFLDLSIAQNVPDLISANTVTDWMSHPPFEEMLLVPMTEEVPLSGWQWIGYGYCLIAALLLCRCFVYFLLLHKLRHAAIRIQKPSFTLYKTTLDRSFSFFSNVFIPAKVFETEAFDQILAHECVHVRHLHSMDRVLMDFVVSLFWINPFIYLYRNALIEIHEFQADEAVIKAFNDLGAYQEILYAQLQTSATIGFVSHFNFQMIKKRIVMMNQTKKGAGWIYALAVPLSLAMMLTFSSRQASHFESVTQEIASLVMPFEYTNDSWGGVTQDANIPSILPFKTLDRSAFQSGFGMRMHPMYKVEKMHSGVDFKCPSGTEIIATAAGTVLKVLHHKAGYGKHIVIDHGNGYTSWYAHLSDFKVEVGANVKKGQVIALSGNTGASTKHHLHYEVRKNGKPLNPAKFIHNYTFKAAKAHRLSSGDPLLASK